MKREILSDATNSASLRAVPVRLGPLKTDRVKNKHHTSINHFILSIEYVRCLLAIPAMAVLYVIGST
jgi:hypothetical protein